MPGYSDLNGSPVLVGIDGSGTALERVPLTAAGKGEFDEAWLQRLIDRNPNCLPFDEIEPSLGRFQGVCRELPVNAGWVDNLLMTADGHIALIETKLFRNPQARREVLAQVLDYAMAVFRMNYAQFERAVLGGQFSPRTRPASLYVALPRPDQMPEAAFVETVSRNLRLGRALIVVAGDGIRNDAEQLLADLHRYARFEFTLALVELAVFRMPSFGELLVRPRALVKTEIIRRHVISLEEGGLASTNGKARDKVATLSSDSYLDALRAAAPQAVRPLQQFVDSLEELGVHPEYRNTLNLKWARPMGDKPVNMGFIAKDGTIWTEAAALAAPRDLAKADAEELAELFGCDVREVRNSGWNLYKAKKPVSVLQVLDRLPAWASAIQRFMAAVSKRDTAAGP